MKKTILFALLAAQPLFAAQNIKYDCKEVNAGADTGFRVTISSDSRSGALMQQTIMGEKLLSPLSCGEPGSIPKQPDDPNAILICVTTHNSKADSAAYVEITQGRVAGLTEAVLSTITYEGLVPLANLLCEVKQSK